MVGQVVAEQVAVSSGVTGAAEVVAQSLHPASWLRAFGYHLLLDLPWGWAQGFFPQDFSGPDGLVIITDNPCPEYRLDLIDLGPRALLPSVSLGQLVHDLPALVARGYPDIVSPLTPRERAVLKRVALARSNAEIAAELGLSERYVKNVVGRVLDKLGLIRRMQLSHYYLGLWHLLENWEPP